MIIEGPLCLHLSPSAPLPGPAQIAANIVLESGCKANVSTKVFPT